MVSLLLLPSPLTRSLAWGGLPEALRDRGSDAVAVEPDDEDRTPFAARWVAACASAARGVSGPLVLVAHSGAGPLLAAVGYALRSAHRPVAAYAFVDAGLPRWDGGSRLDAFGAEDPVAALELADRLSGGGRFPAWSPDDLVDDIPDPRDRTRLVEALRPRDQAYWTEALPEPVDWPDAPCVYLQTSAGYASARREAVLRGWRTDVLDVGHFPGFADPDATANALLDLLGPVTAH